MGGGIIHFENALAGVQQYIIKCEASVQQCMQTVCSSALVAVKHICNDTKASKLVVIKELIPMVNFLTSAHVRINLVEVIQNMELALARLLVFSKAVVERGYNI